MDKSGIKKELLSAHEFAALCGINKSTLLYYDSLGILSPILREDNGYRYYAKAQIYDYETISLLKLLGVSLSEIKGYMGQKNAQLFIDILTAKRNELDRQQRELDQKRRLLQNSISLTEYAMHAQTERVSITRHDDEFFTALFLPQDAQPTSNASLLLLRQYLNEKTDTYQYDTFSWGHIIQYGSLLNHDFSIHCFCGRLDGPGSGPYALTRPAGIYAEMLCRGKFRNIATAFQDFEDQIHQLGYHIVGDLYTEHILCYLMESRPDEYMYRLSIPVALNGKEEKEC